VKRKLKVLMFLTGLLMGSSLGLAQTTESETKFEIEYWQTVKDSDSVEMLNAYLAEFPDGKFATLAEIKIKELTGIDEDVSIGSSSVSIESSQRPALASDAMSDVEKECYEAFHRAHGRWWQMNIAQGDNDSDFDPIPCLPFVSLDMRIWIGSR
jgi:hypothetical protein